MQLRDHGWALRPVSLTALGIFGIALAIGLWTIGKPRPASAAQAPPLTDHGDNVIQGETIVGSTGITETVAEIMAREAETAVRWDGVARPAELDDEEQEQAEGELANALENRQQNPDAPAASQWPPLDNGGPQRPGIAPAGVEGHHGDGPYLPQTLGTSVIGITIAESGLIPPDSHGAVGPDQVVVIANGRIKTLSKTTGLADGMLNTSTDVFFNSVRAGIGTSDPMVKFDRTAGRWFVCMVNVANTNRVLVAVSSGSHISNASSFTFFFYSPIAGLLDYPGMGVDANAVYVGGNNFTPGFTGASGHVIRKSSVTGGGPIVVTVFSVGTTSGGLFAPRGVDNDDASATEGYFIGVDAAVFSRLVMRRVSTPGGTPTISANINITVPTTANPIAGTPAQGSTSPLSALDDRLFAAVVRKNRLTGVSTLWTAHNIQVNASGVASTTGGRNASRWYELQNLTATPTLRQSGTLFDSAATAPNSFWIPSVCMSGQGHMALGCSVAGTTRHAEIAVAGRLAGDALGTIQAPTTVITTATSYNVETGVSSQRWGDYSQTCIDPANDMTMWTFQEYCNASNSWAVRVTKLIAPPPASPSSCAPPAVNQGDSNVSVVLTGTSTGGSGFFDPDATFPNHIAASVPGGGVTVWDPLESTCRHASLSIL